MPFKNTQAVITSYLKQIEHPGLRQSIADVLTTATSHYADELKNAVSNCKYRYPAIQQDKRLGTLLEKMTTDTSAIEELEVFRQQLPNVIILNFQHPEYEDHVTIQTRGFTSHGLAEQARRNNNTPLVIQMPYTENEEIDISASKFLSLLSDDITLYLVGHGSKNRQSIVGYHNEKGKMHWSHEKIAAFIGKHLKQSLAYINKLNIIAISCHSADREDKSFIAHLTGSLVDQLPESFFDKVTVQGNTAIQARYDGNPLGRLIEERVTGDIKVASIVPQYLSEEQKSFLIMLVSHSAFYCRSDTIIKQVFESQADSSASQIKYLLKPGKIQSTTDNSYYFDICIYNYRTRGMITQQIKLPKNGKVPLVSGKTAYTIQDVLQEYLPSLECQPLAITQPAYLLPSLLRLLETTSPRQILLTVKSASL